MPRRLTYEDVKQFVENNSDCELISTEYINNGTKMKFKCGCGNIFETTFRRFSNRNKRQCNSCSDISRIKNCSKTHEEFLKEVYNLVKDEYSVLGEYKGTHTKILIQHNVCGYQWEIQPDSFTSSGKRCPECARKRVRKKRTKTHEQFLSEVYKLVGNEYTFLEKYKNAYTKILVRHNKCGYTWKANPAEFTSAGHRCPKCALQVIGTKLRKTNEQFLKEIFDLVGEEYSVLSTYSDNRTKVKFRHNKCGHIFNMMPRNFIGLKQRCPRCNESHGESAVRKYLRDNHMKFRSQFKIKGCKNKRQLPFDFALFNKDKLIALIEFDGKQHNEVVEHFGGIEGLKERQHNDHIKTNYCLSHNIPLIRISYKVKDISQHLDNEIKKINKKIQLSIL